MKRMSLKTRVVIIDLLIEAFAIAVPLLVFGLFNLWPHPTSVSVLYWISFALFPLINVGWLLFEFFRKDREPSIAYIELFATFGLVLVPFINMIFALFNIDHAVMFIIPLLFDIVVLILYIAMILLLNFASKKVTAALEIHKSEKIESVDMKSYEDDDGNFKGAK